MVRLPGGLPFPETAAEARRLIPDLAARVETADRIGEVGIIGGADASSTRFDPERAVHAAMVSLDARSLQVIGQAGAATVGGLPYVPGLLGFREVPALAEAWVRLVPKPDLILMDGHGIAHPKGFGIACLLGLVLDVPTIGVAKSILVGEVEGELPDVPGAFAPLAWKGRRIGTALRTRRGAKPLYISTGHRVSLEGALAWVERSLRGRRLPEPTRAAHDAAGALRLSAMGALL
ncbi:endonuclease V [Falsiroseomonas oryziterrae]|uniref:endonuclease V n=1 Tax=Falsiroseomonas oryziterrae TaxID=2911368 RepID=UPI001F3029AE|nr:endonuclease V [Roseomonas sp. NPKOSM-4]